MIEQTINPPDLDDLLAESRDVVFSNMNCVQIGKIEKVNSDQTVEIKIQFLRRIQNGKTGKYPLLIDCPYFVLNGGGSYIDMPITKGDTCLVLFSDRNIDNWWDTGNVAIPADTRKHNIADGIAIVGINPKPKSFDFDGSNLRIIVPDKTKISIGNGADELLDLFDQLLTKLQEQVDAAGISSTGTNSLINTDLASIQTKLANIKV